MAVAKWKWKWAHPPIAYFHRMIRVQKVMAQRHPRPPKFEARRGALGPVPSEPVDASPPGAEPSAGKQGAGITSEPPPRNRPEAIVGKPSAGYAQGFFR